MHGVCSYTKISISEIFSWLPPEIRWGPVLNKLGLSAFYNVPVIHPWDFNRIVSNVLVFKNNRYRSISAIDTAANSSFRNEEAAIKFPFLQFLVHSTNLFGWLSILKEGESRKDPPSCAILEQAS